MKHIRNTATAILMMTLLSGCASISTAIKDVNQMLEKSAVDARARALVNVQDPHLVNALYSISPDGKTDALRPSIEAMGFEVFRVGDSSLILRRQDGFRGNMQEMTRDVVTQIKDAERDAVSGEFIQMAIQRGSEVRVYRPALMQRVNGLFKQPFWKARTEKGNYASFVAGKLKSKDLTEREAEYLCKRYELPEAVAA